MKIQRRLLKHRLFPMNALPIQHPVQNALTVGVQNLLNEAAEADINADGLESAR